MIRPGLALRLAQPMRRYASTAAAAGENEFIAQRRAMREHSVHTTDLWRKISFFVCIPGVAVVAAWTYKAEMAHKAHLAHAEHDDRKVYSYMNIRNKPFPWGMQTLFFNPEVNVPVEEA